MTEQYYIVYIYYIFFIHSSFDGHLGCFHILGIIHSANMSTRVHVSFQISVFILFKYIPRIKYIPRLLSYGSLFLAFLKKFYTVFHSDCTNYIPTNSLQGFPFLHIFYNICYLWSF